MLFLLLLLHRFSRVRLCATPKMVAHQAPPIPGILQARTLEWVAISFSNAWKWKGKVKSLSCVWLLATPWTAAYQAPPSMGFSRQEYWSGVPLPSPVWSNFPSLIPTLSNPPSALPNDPLVNEVDILNCLIHSSHFSRTWIQPTACIKLVQSGNRDLIPSHGYFHC